MTGTVYGVGVGPGDPDLLTRRAAGLVETARVIAYPTLAGGDSFARSIVADLIRPGTLEIAIDIPMTLERTPAQAAYDIGAGRIAERLDAGEDVVVLCEGDPFFYGSFMYLHARLKDRFATEVVPGVSSFTACAAAARLPLAARNEVVTVLPGPLSDDDLAERIGSADTLAIMKVGRHLTRLRALLDSLGLLAHAHYVERASLQNEVVLPLAEAPDVAPYFSMIIVSKGADPWL